MSTTIDQLKSTYALPWLLTVRYVDGYEVEYGCADPAVAVCTLEQVLQDKGTKSINKIAIIFRSGSVFRR